ncbi:DUF3488 and transglutaminase-like domain-containing protein [Nocardioides caricicola]|uniref:DUF3488 and transglutaminase-like domain-containing protein n=1 Tax=Nocardioides caricicola TaxID=634770 RepID=A0ABW0MXK1_9ACTN
MSRHRGSLAAHALLAGTAAGTTWIAMYAWRGFAETPGGFLNPLLLLAMVVAGIGVATRWWRWPGPAVFATQVVGSALVACLLITGSPLPVGSGWTELQNAVSQAIDSAQGYPAPVPDEVPPIDPVLILCGLACLLLVDLLACTLRRVPLAGLPLLTIYSIPVSLVDASITWWVFAVTAAGFLTMLFLQESDQVSRWGRPLGVDRETGDPIAFGAGAHVVRGTAGTVGGVATALAVLVPALIPTVGLHVVDFGPGNGGGDEITIKNPTTDLVRDFKSGEDQPLIRFTTTDPDPSYLRILALTRFSDVEWSPGDRDVPSDNVANGLMPPPEGVAAEVSRVEVPYDVTVLPEFDSLWLPTQYPASRVQADGDWRYDSETMDFLAVPDDLTTSGLHYTMSGVDLEITAERLADSGPAAGKVSDTFTEVPDDVPPIVRELAVEVTADEKSQFDKAVALQDWFREDGGFEYSLDTAEGSGYDALVTFLTDGPNGRTGYCEQFASAMAVMARLIGIPARVAVGFLNPTPAGSNTWVYSTNDLHAWPELYFDGAGWVRFEPTPAGRAADVPSYTQQGAVAEPEPEPSAPASSSNVAVPSNRPTESQDTTASSSTDDESLAASYWLPALGVVLAVALVVLALLLPRLLRARRRERRLHDADPEQVWAELRDTAIDLGVAWPTGRSPRVTRDALVHHLGLPITPTTPDRPPHGPEIAPEGVAALDRIVGALERQRYSRPGSEQRIALRADAETCVASLTGGATRAARRRASWWPRSVVAVRGGSAPVTPTTVEARYGGVVDQMN